MMDKSPNYDVVIVGGGLAGVTAARELSHRGLKTAILEAKDRLGGRAWTVEWAGALQELGGGWVHWSQPHVWAEIRRYNLDLFQRPGWPDGEDAYQSPIYGLLNGEAITTTMGANMKQLLPAMEAFAAPSHSLFPRPYDPQSSAIEQYDHLSHEDRLNQMTDLTALQRVLMSRLLSMQCHNHLREGGYVEFLRWYALAHHSVEVYFDTTARFQFTDGTQALVNAIVGDAKADLFLNSPVVAITQNEAGVVVTTQEGKTMTAQAAVLAVPINVLQAIEFSPPLNEAKRALSRERHSGSGRKIFVKVAGHWPNLNCFAEVDEPISTVLVQEARQTETLLVVFTVNERLNPLTKERLTAELQRFVPELQVIDFIYHDWTADPYALGTWCTYRAGQVTKYLREAQAAEERLFFAGSDLANGWRGFFDGAIESGLRVAHEVQSHLFTFLP